MPETQKPRHFLTSQRRTSLSNLLPLAGLACILLGLGCGVAALVIGLVSDGLPQDSWTLPIGVVQPSVLLSVTATLANTFLRAAFTQGAVIAWWVQAHQGASVATLRASYDHANTFLGVFTSPLKFSRVRVAALAMLLLILDGPLLQRASSVQIMTHINNGTKLFVPVSPSPLSLGATGVITQHDGDVPNIYTPSFAQVAKEYSARVPISISSWQHSGTATMDLVAPGFDVSCVNGSSSYRLMSVDEYVGGAKYNYKRPPLTQTMFKIDVKFQFHGLGQQGQNAILLHTSYKSTPGGNGTLSWRNCTLSEAIIRYPVQIENGTVTLQTMPSNENRTQQRIIREGEWNMFSGGPSTIGGLWIALENQYQTSANVSMQPPAPVVLQNENAVASQFLAQGDFNSYDVVWSDPVDVMIAAAHELAFRTAISLTNTTSNLATSTQPEVIYPNLTFVNRSTSQEVTATMVSAGPIYHTDLGWLISGFVMILVACLAVTPLYWAWWGLERSFTLNPLEVSQAFDAPLLQRASTDMPPGAWSHDLKKMRVQYGIETREELLEFNITKDGNTSQSSSIPNIGFPKFRRIE